MSLNLSKLVFPPIPFPELRASLDAVATAAEMTADELRSDLNHDAEANWRSFATYLREISAGHTPILATQQ